MMNLTDEPRLEPHRDSSSSGSSVQSLSIQECNDDLKVNNEAFIHIARTIIKKVNPSKYGSYNNDKSHYMKYMWGSTPYDTQKLFLEALKYRQQHLPMFPDPNENEAISLTRKLSNISLCPVEDKMKVKPQTSSYVRSNLQHLDEEQSELFSVDYEASRATSSHLVTPIVNDYNMKHYVMNPKISTITPIKDIHGQYIEDRNESESTDSNIFEVASTTKYTHDYLKRRDINIASNTDEKTINNDEDNCIRQSNPNEILKEESMTTQSEQSKDKQQVESPQDNLRENPTHEENENESQNQYDKSSYTFAEIMKQRSEVRRQLLAEIRKTNDIIANAPMPSMKELGKQHLKQLQTELQTLNHSPGKFKQIQALISPEDDASFFDNIPTMDPSLSQAGSFITNPLVPNPLQSASFREITPLGSTEVPPIFSNKSSASAQNPPPVESTNPSPKRSVSFYVPPLFSMPSIASYAKSPSAPNPQASPQWNNIPLSPTASHSSQPHQRRSPTCLQPSHNSSLDSPSKPQWKQVQAPQDLPEGYRFRARLGNHSFVATVPSGGVRKGDIFNSLPEPATENSVITRRWRDGLLNCFDFGIGHPMLWNGTCFPLIGLAQIMKRLNLDWTGALSISNQPLSIASAIIITICTFCVNILLLSLPFDSIQLNYILIGIFNAICFGFYIVVVTRVRKHIRQRYFIPETTICLPELDDFGYSLFCSSCTVMQMNRHTAEFDTYRALFCSENGLPAHVKLPLPPASSPRKNQYMAFGTP